MSWRPVAKKEISDASRSLVLWVISGVFLLFAVFVVGAFVIIEGSTGGPETPIDVLVFVLSPVALFAPIIALLVGYKAIVGERESGSLRVLLSLPHTRWDVMLGKLVGRTVVMAIPVALAFVLMAILISVFVAPIAVVEYLVVFSLSILFAAAFVSIAVAVSSSSRSSTIAGAAMFGLYALFVVFWDVLQLGLLYLLEGRLVPVPDPPSWYFLVDMLSPNGAYLTAAQGLLSTPGLYQGFFPGAVPLYLSAWAAIAVLVLWVVVPFGLGYLRFRDADL